MGWYEVCCKDIRLQEKDGEICQKEVKEVFCT